MSKLETYIITIVLNKAAYDSFFLLFFNTGVKAISDYDRNNAYDIVNMAKIMNMVNMSNIFNPGNMINPS